MPAESNEQKRKPKFSFFNVFSIHSSRDDVKNVRERHSSGCKCTICDEMKICARQNVTSYRVVNSFLPLPMLVAVEGDFLREETWEDAPAQHWAQSIPFAFTTLWDNLHFASWPHGRLAVHEGCLRQNQHLITRMRISHKQNNIFQLIAKWRGCQWRSKSYYFL